MTEEIKESFAEHLPDLNNNFVKKAAGLLEGYLACRCDETQAVVNNINNAFELIREVEDQMEHLTYGILYPE
jgi:hypothetical protein